MEREFASSVAVVVIVALATTTRQHTHTRTRAVCVDNLSQKPSHTHIHTHTQDERLAKACETQVRPNHILYLPAYFCVCVLLHTCCRVCIFLCVCVFAEMGSGVCVCGFAVGGRLAIASFYLTKSRRHTQHTRAHTRTHTSSICETKYAYVFFPLYKYIFLMAAYLRSMTYKLYTHSS